MSKFSVRAVETGYKFDLHSSNGQVIATSEIYDTRAACLKGIESVRKNGPFAPVEDLTESCTAVSNPKFQLFQDKAGQYRFRLKARNGKIIAVSEGYETRSGCENGIRSIRENAPVAQIEEL